MTRVEFRDAFAIIKLAYPHFYKGVHDDEIAATISLWYEFFAEFDYLRVCAALKTIISTKKDFPPTVAEVLEAVNFVSGEKVADADEIWAEIIRAIRYYGWYKQKEAMAAISQEARDAVKFMGWRELCASEDPMADRAHFLKVYPAILARKKTERQLPQDVKNYISETIRQKKAIEQSKNTELLPIEHSRKELDEDEYEKAYSSGLKSVKDVLKMW
ncbi:hypothetical protein AGMMS49975_23260 [Clostridia bacterium]|nr:hypothetical protein AGMMS49975_23260 [Clostridia bacterium]